MTADQTNIYMQWKRWIVEAEYYSIMADNDPTNDGVVGLYSDAIARADVLQNKFRQSLELEKKAEWNVEYAVASLTKALVNDSSYRESWKANIAMAFKDEWQRTVVDFGQPEYVPKHIHEIADKAADCFLDNLCRNVK